MDPSLIFLFVASIFLILGFYFYNRAKHLLTRGRKANAIIFKNNYKASKHGGHYYPVVRFLTKRNEWITQELSIGYSVPKDEGSKVEVLYDPMDPTVVELNGRLHLEVLPKIFIGIGFLALLVALGMVAYGLF